MWTRLSKTALQGSTSLQLEEAVDWSTGEEILVTSTSYSAWQTETFRITQISADKTTLTLNDTLKFKHLGMVSYMLCRNNLCVCSFLFHLKEYFRK